MTEQRKRVVRLKKQVLRTVLTANLNNLVNNEHEDEVITEATLGFYPLVKQIEPKKLIYVMRLDYKLEDDEEDYYVPIMMGIDDIDRDIEFRMVAVEVFIRIMKRFKIEYSYELRESEEELEQYAIKMIHEEKERRKGIK